MTPSLSGAGTGGAGILAVQLGIDRSSPATKTFLEQDAPRMLAARLAESLLERSSSRRQLWDGFALARSAQ